MCRKHNEHISYNAASICSFYNNPNSEVHSKKKKRSKVVLNSEIHNILLIQSKKNNLNRRIASKMRINFQFENFDDNKMNAIMQVKEILLLEENNKVYKLFLKDEPQYLEKARSLIYNVDRIEKFFVADYVELYRLNFRNKLYDSNYKNIVLVDKCKD